ncbi:MAG TPA: superoxide dismutase [Candidatus Nanoarchaeia archaeon]|nr:superoxide dismutase [Candidatus Nanoarchaeia archaeon]
MHTVPNLPYDYNALEPYIDEQTMRLHHDKHHQAYVDKLNAAIQGTAFEGMDIHDVLTNLNQVPENIRAAVRNHGGGHANHSFFWQVMAPSAGGMPAGKIAEKITESFGSFDKFREQFAAAALGQFGSGWAWLALNSGKLEIIATPNQDSPLSQGKTPLLGIDVWEHAYYLKYQNRRPDYITAWWNVVNWKEVEKRFADTQ